MTNTRKTTTPPTETEAAPETVPAKAAETVVGPALRHGQEPEKVTFAHHLRIAGHDFKPGESALVSPDYARQLRGNGYVARGRA
ncbi:hypothetical protein ACPCSC_30460 [Streptomyces lavendulocolor]|uniref:hypothetical protein n=1 Tax=Streptomyces lavendulocolor TaxID=67316 RepID=UPI003C2E4507